MNQNHKVCILTSAHMSQDIRIFHKQCKSLANAGYQVVEIAQNEKEEIVDKIKIVPLPIPKNRFDRMTINIWKLFKLALNEKAEIYHFHDPDIIPAAILLRLSGKKVIYDAHEDYPKAILSKTWIPAVFRYPISFTFLIFEWVSSKLFFNKIVAAWPRIVNHLPKKKTVIVENFSITEELIPENPTPYIDRPPNIIYVGLISKIRGIIENIKAMELIKNDACRFSLAGKLSGDGLMADCISLSGWEKIDYREWLTREEIKLKLDSSRIGIVIFHPHPNHVNAHPNKLFEYMAAGLPVITSNFPLWQKFVKEHKCGLTVDPMKPQEIADAIDWLLDHPQEAEQMGKNGRQAVIEKYNWENEEKKLLKLYEKLLQK